MLYVAEADEHYTASSNGIPESLHSETRPVYNASSTSKAALLSIFAKYGQNGSLSFEGFEHLLESLGLGNIVIPDHNISEHHSVTGSWSVELHPDHQHSAADLRREHHDEAHVSHVDDNKEHEHHTSSAVCTNCLSSKVKCHFSFTMAISTDK